MRMRKLFGLSMFAMLLASMMLTAGVAAQDATPAAQPSFPVQVRFLNAMTAQKEIDVFINGSNTEQRVAENLPYGEFSDYFVGSAPATNIVVKRNVKFGFDQWLFDFVLPTEAGRSYVVVISDFAVIPTQVDTSVSVDDGARGKFVHASSQAPSIDITANGEVVATDLRYGEVGYGGVLVPGTYDVQLLATGTSTVALEVPQLTIEAGMTYTFVAIGEPGSTEEPLTVVVASDTLQAA